MFEINLKVVCIDNVLKKRQGSLSAGYNGRVESIIGLEICGLVSSTTRK